MRLLKLFFLVLIAVSTATAQGIKCATVDANTLLTQYHVAKKEISVLKNERDKYVKEREKRSKALGEVETKIKALITKLRDKAMPESERTTLREQYEYLVSEHNALSKDIKESDLDQMREIKGKIAIATRRLLDEIQVVVRQYAKDNKYHWIIDTSGSSNTQISPLIYAREAADVTEEILAILNQDAPKEEETTDTTQE